ncbi:jg15614 [Pararge aegeria aegeria]|uniref:Jg15614 protein n=1 Tax=Pararge aegeria aegeria TaxID=348720 RepID=A0A8S4RUB0_9NEOP|nr:jg15614 [Pararge aegeria aegeria]
MQGVSPSVGARTAGSTRWQDQLRRPARMWELFIEPGLFLAYLFRATYGVNTTTAVAYMICYAIRTYDMRDALRRERRTHVCRVRREAATTLSAADHARDSDYRTSSWSKKLTGITTLPFSDKYRDQCVRFNVLFEIRKQGMGQTRSPIQLQTWVSVGRDHQHGRAEAAPSGDLFYFLLDTKNTTEEYNERLHACLLPHRVSCAAPPAAAADKRR